MGGVITKARRRLPRFIVCGKPAGSSKPVGRERNTHHPSTASSSNAQKAIKPKKKKHAHGLMPVLIINYQLWIWHMLKNSYKCMLTQQDMETHITRAELSAPARKQIKLTLAGACLPINFPLPPFSFNVSFAFYFADGVLSGGSSRWFCTSRLWHRQRTRPHDVPSHTKNRVFDEVPHHPRAWWRSTVGLPTAI